MHVSRYTVGFFDENGDFIKQKEYDSSDFEERFDDCGVESTYINPRSNACGRLCANIGGREFGSLVYSYYGTDDNGNSVSQSAKVYFSAP